MPVAEAMQTILADAAGNQALPAEEPVLLVFIHEDKPYLAWHVTVEGIDQALGGGESPALWAYFVDAQAGKVIWRYNNLQAHTATSGSGTGVYAGVVSMNTLHNHANNKYQLEDRALASTARIYTHDANGGAAPGPASEDADNNWNAANQRAEVDCHVFTRMVFDVFFGHARPQQL